MISRSKEWWAARARHEGDQDVTAGKPVKPSKTCLFDMDGTLADFDGKLRADLAAIASSPNEREQFLDPSFDIWTEGNRPWLDERKRIIKAQPGWWRDLPTFRLGMMLWEFAGILGFERHVLTRGPWSSPLAWAQKVEWCQKNLGPEHPCTVTRDKSLVYGRVLVDDWPDYVDPWLQRRPRGLVIMPAHRWNEDYKHERAIRFTGENVGEVCKALEEAYNR